MAGPCPLPLHPLLTPDQLYTFDVSGFIVVPRLIPCSRLTSSSRQQLAADQALQPYLESLCTDGHHRGKRSLGSGVYDSSSGYAQDGANVVDSYRLEREPVLVEQLPTGATTRLLPRRGLAANGNVRHPSRAYYFRSNVRVCPYLVAVVAIADRPAGAGGLLVLPSSHKSDLPPPPYVFQRAEANGVQTQPALHAGDVLLIAGSTLCGLAPWSGSAAGGQQQQQQLLMCEYISASLRHASEDLQAASPPPSWLSQLSPPERAMLGYAPPRAAVAASEPEMAADRVRSDGQQLWLASDDGSDDDIVFPYSTESSPDSAGAYSAEELYWWDLHGHIVLRGVLTPDELDAANRAIDAHLPPPPPTTTPSPSSGDSGLSARLAGTAAQRMGGLCDLPPPANEPFLRMLAHPAVVARLQWMSGPGSRLGQEAGKRGAVALISAPGSAGHSIHAGVHGPLDGPGGTSHGWSWHRQYQLMSGGGGDMARCYCPQVNVAFQLRDALPGDGGYCALLGSHKASYAMPRGREDSIDLPGVEHVPMRAGDVLMFMGMAQNHGAFAWRGQHARRAVLLNYFARDHSPRL